MSHRRAISRIAAALAAIAMFQIGGCPNGILGPPQGTATETISAAAGGRVLGSTGYELEIPPGALAEDTEITLTPLSAARLADLEPRYLAGVVLEPEGLTFSRPATLRVPLPAPWPHTDPPMELMFKGTDPAEAVETGRLVGLSEDGRFAIFEVLHFSGRICANQCHAGVREYLEAQYAARGCARAEWSRRVTGKYPGLELRESCEFIAPEELIAILDSMFDEFGEWSGGVDVPADKLAELEQIAESGRFVVFLFGKDAFTPRGGARNFFGNVAHSAIAEKRAGRWEMRNAFVPGKVARLLPDGTNLVWWPMDDLNAFRNLQQGVAIEIAVCGSPGCLGTDDPFDTSKPYDPLEKRTVIPWNAVRIFVEREQNSPCSRLAGCWRFSPEEIAGGAETLLLQFDEAGRVDALWFAFANDGSIETDADTVFLEFLRFTRPNAAFINEVLESIDSGVFPSEDQQQFTAVIEWETATRDDDGAVRSRSSTFMAFNDSQMSTNEPGEYFISAFEQVTTTTTYDEDGNATVSEDRASGTIRGERVACPDPAAGNVVLQEGWGDLFDFDFDLCGAGAVATMPFMIVGMIAMRPMRRIALRRH